MRYIFAVLSSDMSKGKYNRIKIVLAEKNITNRDLAAGIGKTEATVSRWCTNEVQPSIETLYQVAKYLDVEVRELLVLSKEK